MLKYTLNIESEAVNDIQQTIIYYNNLKPQLGKKFFNQIDKHFRSIKMNPKAFAVRYDEIRCLPVKKFPYMIHYKVNEEKRAVTVKAVFCTYLNPRTWGTRD